MGYYNIPHARPYVLIGRCTPVMSVRLIGFTDHLLAYSCTDSTTVSYPSNPLAFFLLTHIYSTMGLTDNKLVARFINGDAPPASYKESQKAQPPLSYEAEANKKLLRNDRLQKTQIYLNLPIQKEREEKERRARGTDKP